MFLIRFHVPIQAHKIYRYHFRDPDIVVQHVFLAAARFVLLQRPPGPTDLTHGPSSKKHMVHSGFLRQFARHYIVDARHYIVESLHRLKCYFYLLAMAGVERQSCRVRLDSSLQHRHIYVIPPVTLAKQA